MSAEGAAGSPSATADAEQAELDRLLDCRKERKWDSFSWTTMRALVSSLNHVLNLGAPDLVPDIRQEWLRRTGAPKRIERHDDTAFIVLGDPGEQDESQYVVVRRLRAAARGDAAPGFMVVCSDVIYPSGDVNDYLDGFYVPYRALENADGERLPVYALPGNHDWYDGLAGFMWHFCHEDEPPASTVYAGRGSWREWVLRLLWRRPSNVKSQLRLEQRRAEVLPEPLQHTPYFVIDTRHVRLVCIDTGIDGCIDPVQAKWLVEVSADPAGGRAKVLLTGKPLLVDRARRTDDLPEAGVPAHGGAGAVFHSVDQIVRHPAHRYVASIGGDIHNFQHYVDVSADRPFHYVVSGGGGAYMSATHPLAIAERDRHATGDPPEPTHLYPDEAQSLCHFARQMLPRIWRLFRALVLVVLGVVAAAAWIGLSDDAEAQRAALKWTAIGVGGWLVLRSLVPGRRRRSAPFRLGVCAASLATGVVLGLAGWWLAPHWFGTDLWVWLGLLLGGMAIALVVRLTHWWRGREPGWHVRTRWLVLLGLVLLGVTGFALSRHAWLGAAAAVVTGIVAAVTWAIRGAAWWTPGRAIAVAFFVQAADALVILDAVAPRSARGALWAAAGGVVGGAIVVAAAIFLLLPAVAYVIAFLFCFCRESEAWGRFGGPAQAAMPFVASGALAAAAVALRPGAGADPDAWRAAIVAGTTLPAIVGAVFLVDWARRHARWSLSAVDAFGAGVALYVLWRADVIDGLDRALAAFAAVAAVLLAGLMRSVLRANAFKLDLTVVVGAALALCWSYGLHETWVPRAAAAAAVVVALTVVGAALAHLVFIGVPQMTFDCPTHRDGEQLTREQADQIICWRKTEPSRSHRPERRLRIRANVVFPGLHRASGPLQQKVAEVFDSDDPPFAKNFLVVTTTAEAMTIRMQPVAGPGSAPESYCFRVPLS